MGIMEGGTRKDFARVEAMMCFGITPEDKLERRLSIHDIAEKRLDKSPGLIPLAEEALNEMVDRYSLDFSLKGKTLVFDKDDKERFFYRPATFKDRIKNRWYRLVA